MLSAHGVKGRSRVHRECLRSGTSNKHLPGTSPSDPGARDSVSLKWRLSKDDLCWIGRTCEPILIYGASFG